MSWLGWLNYLVLQWFFVRLAKMVDEDSGEVVGYRWLTGIVPLTGWGGPYMYITKRD